MVRRVLVILIICLLSTVTPQNLRRQKRIVGGRPAAKPPVDDPVVHITKNDRYAQIHGTRDPNQGFYVFRGIRFAQPPVGEHRFQRPIPLHLEGEINAKKWGAPCPQPSNTNDNQTIGNEDCLFLNVFTPMLPDSGDGYPVLIWIHGGGFRRGSACQYEMRNLIKKKMIVVSIQYRLGSLGFLSTGNKELPGNNGMFDMMLAVNWVRDHIEYFGGNPKKIIAFGHGTGASSAIMLSMCNLLKDTFSGLIAMSGTILSHFSIDKNPLNTAQYIASKNGCPTNNTIEMIYCLKQMPVEKLVQADSELASVQMAVQGFISTLSNLLGPGPVIDGADDERSLPNFMTNTPEDSLKFGNFPSIPLLTGVMKDEMGGAIFGDYKQEVQNNLKNIPNFLNEYLVPTLQSTVSNFGNGSEFVPEAFSRYLNMFENGNADNKLIKVAEAMGDSLFNAPAFLTVDHWAKKAKTYLYSFDYNGKRNYGKDFLIGSPIAKAKNVADGFTNHGDDLGYIFGRNTITGETIESLNEEQNEEDRTVMEIFTNMIADFVRNGEPNLATQFKNSSWFQQIIPSFSSETNSYISVTSEPHLMEKFRYCEMGLWTGIVNRLQSPACSLFKTSLDMVQHGAKKSINLIGEPIATFGDAVGDFVPKPTILSNNSKINSNKQHIDEKPTKSGKGKLMPGLPKLGRVPFLG